MRWRRRESRRSAAGKLPRSLCPAPWLAPVAAGSSACTPTTILRDPEVSVCRFDYLRVPLLQSRGQRTVRDEELQAEVSRVHTENYSVYGAHKVWLEMRSEGIDVARWTIDGCLRARMRTKRHDQAHRHRRSTRTSRGRSGAVRFNPVTPKMLWVSASSVRRLGLRGVSIHNRAASNPSDAEHRHHRSRSPAPKIVHA